MYPNQNHNNRKRGNYPPNNKKPEPPPEIKAEPLPQDYVDAAEKVMRSIYEDSSRITSSKIRNLLSLVSDIYNRENLRTADTITADSQAGLTALRIRMVYEAGRDQAVKCFVKKAKLLQYLKGLGNSRENLMNFAHYMEALVAYHRFIIGGKEG